MQFNLDNFHGHCTPRLLVSITGLSLVCTAVHMILEPKEKKATTLKLESLEIRLEL